MMMVSEDVDMTDTTTTDTTEAPKTAMDARMDALQAQMDSMKVQYESQMKSYQDANRQLFAMLNRQTKDDEPVTEEPAVTGFDLDKAEKAFMKRYTRISD